MAVAASAGCRPRPDRIRTAPAWMLMPTPSGFSSLTASKTSTSKPARWRHLAAVRPPMPAPAMAIFMTGLRVAAQPAIEQGGLVGGPLFGVAVAELAQVRPAIDAGVVAIIEHDADGVVADRLDGGDLHMAAAGYDLLLAGSMALHFGRRALDAQILGRQRVGDAVGELDLHAALFLEDAQLGRPWRGGLVAAFVGRRLGELPLLRLIFSAHGTSLI